MIKKIYTTFISMLPKKNIILLESHSDFCDSSKKIYDTLIKYNLNDKFKIVWTVEHPDNFKSLSVKNLKFINLKSKKIKERLIRVYYYSFAKYCFYTHRFIGLPNNKGQIIYFLNHSSFPIKDVRGQYCSYEDNTYIETTSDLSAKYRCKALGGGLEKMKSFGLPRNDELFESDRSKEKLGLNKYNKVFIWMPTFKHHKNKIRNDFNSDTQKDISILSRENLKIVNDILNERNSILIIKFHPSQDMDFVDEFEFSNILFMTNKILETKQVDLYNLLGQTDALITDFSSVYFDYLLLNKPIGFELGDKEKYEKGTGFLVENPLDYMPGEKIYSIENMKKFIIDVCSDKDEHKQERKNLLNKIHDYKDGKSSERILKFLNLID